MKNETVSMIVVSIIVLAIFIIPMGAIVYAQQVKELKYIDYMTKNVYCDQWAEEQGIDNETNLLNYKYRDVNGVDYCWGVEVDMNCHISLQGSACFPSRIQDVPKEKGQ